MRRVQRITGGKLRLNVSKQGAAGGSFLYTLVNNLPFEMHLPGHICTDPGTKLYKRLNSNGTPKDVDKQSLQRSLSSRLMLFKT